jgi:RNA polymerase sigma-70 factor (family 1)
MPNSNEYELICALKTGDTNVFTQFYQQHFKTIKLTAWFVVKSEAMAEDITQQAFIKLWEVREQLNENLSVIAYLRRISNNLTLDHLRRERSFQKYRQHHEGEEITAPVYLYDQKKYQLILEQAVASLPNEKQQIFRMSRFEDRSYKEIAETLNTTPKAIERHMARTLQFVRKYITRHIDHSFLIAVLISLKKILQI